jgi:hypothetical protein
MKFHWTDLAITPLLVGAGCAAIYAGLVRVIRRTANEQEQATERELGALSATVKTLQSRVAGLEHSRTIRTEAAELPATSGNGENMAGAESEQLKPETLVAITAAATAFLGKQARVRSAQSLPAANDNAGAWAQQGRVIVQTSHNLRPRD